MAKVTDDGTCGNYHHNHNLDLDPKCL